MAKVTYNPGKNDPDDTETLGYAFKGGVPVTVDNAAALNKFRRNPYFSVDDEGQAPATTQEPPLPTVQEILDKKAADDKAIADAEREAALARVSDSAKETMAAVEEHGENVTKAQAAHAEQMKRIANAQRANQRKNADPNKPSPVPGTLLPGQSPSDETKE